jgi:predicted glutamate--cysteine ligase
MFLKGIEEEVYAGSMDGSVLPLSTQVTDDLDGFVREPDARNIEYATSPTADYMCLAEQLQASRDTLSAYLADRDFAVIPGSCMSLPHDPEFLHSTPGNPYHAHIRKAHGTSVVTTSCHINISVEDPEEMIRAYRIIRMEAPLFLALSAGSPFLNGQATGAHSTRWKMFPQTPKDVPLFTGYSHYCDWVQQKLCSGEMYNIRHLWLSVRPNGVQPLEKLERLELRVCDQMGDLAVMMAVTALFEARIMQILDHPKLDPLAIDWIDSANRAPALVALATANESAAATNSLDAEYRDWRTGRNTTVRHRIVELVESVRPLAAAAGFEEQLLPLQCVLKNGNTAQRWLKQFHAGQTIPEIIQQAIRQKFDCAVEQKCML